MRPFIVVGDKTDHGGTVIQGSAVSDAAGKMIARVGDQVTCPKNGHGHTTVIVSGDPTFVMDGQPVARHGDKCACGATLLSSQVVSFTDEGSPAGAAGGSGNSAGPAGAIPSTTSTRFEYDEQVELVTNTAYAVGLRYFIKTADGREFSGRVGADHKLPRIDTASASSYEVLVGDEALALIEGVS